MDNFKIFEGKKYMWDGENYDSESAALDKMSEYSNNGFQTKIIEEEGKFLVYTRRVVTDIQVDGEPV